MVLNLEANGTLRMAGARGVTVEVLDGHVWITRAGRAEDLILARGASYEVEGEGVVLVGLERRARLDLRTGGKAPWWRRLARAWAAAADARRAARELAELPEHRLRDLGLTRDQIPSAVYIPRQ